MMDICTSPMCLVRRRRALQVIMSGCESGSREAVFTTEPENLHSIVEAFFVQVFVCVFALSLSIYLPSYTNVDGTRWMSLPWFSLRPKSAQQTHRALCDKSTCNWLKTRRIYDGHCH